MTPQHDSFDTFYDDEVAAYRQFSPRDPVWDKISQPTLIVSVLVVLLTLGYNLYGTSATVQGTGELLGTCLWDALVYVVPQRLLDALDTSSPSSAAQSMFPTDRSAHAAKSEMMRRVLGLDRSGGVMASVFQARNRALSMTGSVLGLKLDTDRPPGLGNHDNSCYQNSILQGLSSLRPLPDYLSAHLSTVQGSDQDVAQTLRTLIADLNDVSNNGRTLWTPSVLKSMSTWTQQDAQEYYSKILDDIDKSVAKVIKSQQKHPGLETRIDKEDETDTSQRSDDSGYQSLSSSIAETKLPRNPLEGLLAQRVACVQCGHTDGLSMIPFTCLTLSLGLHKNQHDLYERMDAYTKVEAIEDVECPKCTLLKAQRLLSRLVERMRESGTAEEQLAEPLRRLEAVHLALEEDDFQEKTLTEQCKISAQSKVSTTKTKQIVIARPPQSLAIHMNRSVFDPSTFNMMKNSAPVNFPLTLDLGPWCLGSAGDRSGAVSELGAKEAEQWLSDPRASMISGDSEPSKWTGPIYELRAVVTHYGRHENGHYICYRKYPRQNPPTKANEQQVDLSAEHGEQLDNLGVQPDVETEEQPEDKAGDQAMDWWRLSDQNVSMISEDHVLSLSPGVFMLFYDCVDPTTILVSEEEASTHDVQGTAKTSDSHAREGAVTESKAENEVETNVGDGVEHAEVTTTGV